jgi:hypothetical protein
MSLLVVGVCCRPGIAVACLPAYLGWCMRMRMPQAHVDVHVPKLA